MAEGEGGKGEGCGRKREERKKENDQGKKNMQPAENNSRSGAHGPGPRGCVHGPRDFETDRDATLGKVNQDFIALSSLHVLLQKVLTILIEQPDGYPARAEIKLGLLVNLDLLLPLLFCA